MRITLVAVLAAASTAAATGAAEERPGFQLVATYRGQGGQFASAVGPGPSPGTERLYATYLYYDDTFEVVAVDPGTGAAKVYGSPVRSEYASRCMTVGPDGNVYLGTAPGAHLMKLDTRAEKLVDLGRPSATEDFVWDVAFGPDGKLYGGTHPSAKLVRYDPRTGAVEDLGRMDPTEQYAHYVAASGDGFVYVGIGTGKMNVAAYHIASGERREILPERFRKPGQAVVFQGPDGAVYATAGSQQFRLRGWTAEPVERGAARVPPNRLRDGQLITLQPNTVSVEDPRSGKSERRPFAYPGRTLPIFRITLGPDGLLYGSSELPARLLRLDEARARLEELGDLGDGEVYSFLAHRGRLLMAAYASRAPLMVFDPGRPFQKEGQLPNPSLVKFPGADSGWRPVALVNGPDGKAYAGAIAGYGKLGGPMCAWDLATGNVDLHPNVLPDHSVFALASWRGWIVGGTTIRGGMGSVPTQKSARVFVWDPATQKVLFDLEPVPGAEAIENLAAAPGGLVYGIAGGRMFALDVERRAVTLRKDLPFPGGTVYGALAPGPDGRLWGLAGHPGAGVYAIDTGTAAITLVAKPPKPITAGFAMKGDFLYFASGSELYRFALPGPGGR